MSSFFDTKKREAREASYELNGVLYRGLVRVPEDGAFTVTDPCYIPDSPHGYVAVQTDWAARGVKWAKVFVEYERGTVKRFYLSVTQNDEPHKALWRGRIVGWAGVDSGQVIILPTNGIETWQPQDGIVPSWGENDAELKNPANDYIACGIATMLTPEQGGMVHGGYVTSTAYGDGQYPVYLEANTIMVDFDAELDEIESDYDTEWDDEDDLYEEDDD